MKSSLSQYLFLFNYIGLLKQTSFTSKVIRSCLIRTDLSFHLFLIYFQGAKNKIKQRILILGFDLKETWKNKESKQENDPSE